MIDVELSNAELSISEAQVYKNVIKCQKYDKNVMKKQ